MKKLLYTILLLSYFALIPIKAFAHSHSHIISANHKPVRFIYKTEIKKGSIFLHFSALLLEDEADIIYDFCKIKTDNKNERSNACKKYVTSKINSIFKIQSGNNVFNYTQENLSIIVPQRMKKSPLKINYKQNFKYNLADTDNLKIFISPWINKQNYNHQGIINLSIGSNLLHKHKTGIEGQKAYGKNVVKETFLVDYLKFEKLSLQIHVKSAFEKTIENLHKLYNKSKRYLDNKTNNFFKIKGFHFFEYLLLIFIALALGMLCKIFHNKSKQILLVIFRNKLFPIVFQIPALFIYLALIWFALGLAPPKDMNPMQFAQNNMSSLIVWGIWLPLLVIITVFVGRIWCAVCPLELVQQIGAWIGKKLLGRRLHLLPFLRNSMPGVVIYSLLLFMLIATRYPRITGNTATLLSFLLLFTLITAMLFGNRIFCLVFCPANMLLSALGRRGMLRIQHNAKESSQNKPVSNYNCPSNLNYKKLKDSSHCTFCGKCVKANHNMQPILRRMPFIPNDSTKEYGHGIILLVFILIGFVPEHLSHDWQFWNQIYSYIPSMIKNAVAVPVLARWIEAIWAMIITPGLLWLMIGIIGKIINSSLSLTQVWRNSTLPALTAVTGLHLIMSMEKFSHWATHIPDAIFNLKKQIVTNFFPESFFLLKFSIKVPGKIHCHRHDTHLLWEPILQMWMITIVILFILFLFQEIRKANNDNL